MTDNNAPSKTAIALVRMHGEAWQAHGSPEEDRLLSYIATLEALPKLPTWKNVVALAFCAAIIAGFSFTIGLHVGSWP